MAMFHVRFLKDVCNDTGHTRCIVQRALLVEAQDVDAAAEIACGQFGDHESIGDWRLRADRLEIDQVDWSKDLSRNPPAGSPPGKPPRRNKPDWSGR